MAPSGWVVKRGFGEAGLPPVLLGFPTWGAGFAEECAPVALHGSNPGDDNEIIGLSKRHRTLTIRGEARRIRDTGGQDGCCEPAPGADLPVRFHCVTPERDDPRAQERAEECADVANNDRTKIVRRACAHVGKSRSTTSRQPRRRVRPGIRAARRCNDARDCRFVAALLGVALS